MRERRVRQERGRETEITEKTRDDKCSEAKRREEKRIEEEKVQIRLDDQQEGEDRVRTLDALGFRGSNLLRSHKRCGTRCR